MFKFLKQKKVVIPSEEQTDLTTAIETWMVEWNQSYDNFYNDPGSMVCLRKAYQGFLSREEADRFVTSLRDAQNVLGNEFSLQIKIYSQTAGLQK